MSVAVNNGGNRILLFLPILILIIILVAISLGALDTLGLPTLSDLPMTQHAAQGRVGTTMDAEAIRQMIDNRACKPIEFYICPSVNQSKAICYLKVSATDELWAGVIVGLHTPNKIITGYVAPYFEYWVPANARDGCWLASRIN